LVNVECVRRGDLRRECDEGRNLKSV
jgi:hypothetical protein